MNFLNGWTIDLVKDPYHSHTPPKPSLSTSVTLGCHSPLPPPGSSTLSSHSPSLVSSPLSNLKVPLGGTQDGISSDGFSFFYSFLKLKLFHLKNWIKCLMYQRRNK